MTIEQYTHKLHDFVEESVVKHINLQADFKGGHRLR